MGYRSDFHLTVDPPLNVASDLNEITDYRWSSDLTLYEAKWYDAEPNMEALSKRFPDHKFTVHVFGEDGAQWIIDAYNGLTDTRYGVMTFPPRTLWEEPKHG